MRKVLHFSYLVAALIVLLNAPRLFAQEDFDSFRGKFFSNTTFQLQRIKFPLKVTMSESGNRAVTKKYSKAQWQEYYHNVLEEANERLSVLDEEGEEEGYYYSYGFEESGNTISFFVEDELFALYHTLVFERIKNKWYLVEMEEGNN